MRDVPMDLKKAALKGGLKGRVEGQKEAKWEHARKMKAKGYPIEDIADITGLSKEEVASL